MFKRTPRKSASFGAGGPSTPASSGSRGREGPKGLFENWQWFCDCEPRQPAVHLQVRKKNRNNGRWFYTCQKEKKKQCDFFMWKDAAQAMEKEYLFNGGRERDEGMIRTYIGASSPPLPASLRSSGYVSQLRQQQHSMPVSDDGRGYSLPTVSTGDEMDFMSYADEESQKRSSEMPGNKEEDAADAMPEARPSAKRKRGLFVDSDEELFGADDDEVNPEEERDMVGLAENATRSQQSQRQSQSQQSAGQFTTPSATRTHDVLNGIPTPSSNTCPTVARNTLLVATEQREREAKRLRMDPAAAVTPSSSSLMQQTPAGSSGSGSGNGSTVRGGAGSGAGGDDYPITEEVMALLGGVPMLDDDVASSVRQKLNNYALRMKGVERGRDMVRSTVQAKEAKIAELQARVTQLEKRRIADSQHIKALAGMISERSEE